MDELKGREHDFSAKLRQASLIERLKRYIDWQRSIHQGALPEGIPDFGPVSINLDLTMACNFACEHCVDSTILNAGKSLPLKEIRMILDALQDRGLLSVILVGGGEPTLHRHFEEVVRTIKAKKLQLGIVTNGSKLEKVATVAALLEEKDWVRISIDAAREETYRGMHRPKVRLTLEQLLEKAGRLKDVHPTLSLGYSFVIVWEGIEMNGKTLTPNIDEMADAVILAERYGFDYVSFKPCLVRLEKTRKESLLDHVSKEQETALIERIKKNLDQAREVAAGKIKILESVNLIALLNGQADRIKRQPPRCHMPFFRTVVAPAGVFHCPAFRGVDKARIGERDAYLRFDDCLQRTAESILNFPADKECDVVGCFYHHTNWWLETFIHSTRETAEIESVTDDNYFL
jgi:MoaA/NifB/PqqE/SkfB family radical SAM enzyme